MLYNQFQKLFQLCSPASCTFLVNCTFLINFRSQDILNTQSFAKAVSKNGVVFLGLVSNSAVGCVNEHQVLQKENFVSNFLIFLLFFILFYHIFLISLSIRRYITSIKHNFPHEDKTSTARFGRNASHVIKCNACFWWEITWRIIK